MDRPYMETTIEDLEKLVDKHKSDRVVLAQVREELGFRKRQRAKQLLREVQGLLGGEVKMPRKPPKPDSPDDQLPLVD
jgi:hypothetical protein